jgi:signal transduction histidine kinase
VGAAGLGLHRQRVARVAFVQRLQHERALADERARIARDLHDQLGSDLTRIALEGEFAARSCQNCLNVARAEVGQFGPHSAAGGVHPDAAAVALGRIQGLSASVRDAFRSLDEMIWAVNPKQDTLAGLANYLCEYTLGFLRSADIRCRLDVPPDLPARPLRAGVRHELFLVIKEGLHNTVKHATAHEVHLRIGFTPAHLELELSDDGRGFDQVPVEVAPPPAARARNGLANMRQRVSAMGGRLDLTSTPGHGTQLRITVPFQARPA